MDTLLVKMSSDHKDEECYKIFLGDKEKGKKPRITFKTDIPHEKFRAGIKEFNEEMKLSKYDWCREKDEDWENERSG